MYLVHDARGRTMFECQELGEATYRAYTALAPNSILYIQCDSGVEICFYGRMASVRRAPVAIETTADHSKIVPENAPKGDTCARCGGVGKIVSRLGRNPAAMKCSACNGTGKNIPSPLLHLDDPPIKDVTPEKPDASTETSGT